MKWTFKCSSVSWDGKQTGCWLRGGTSMVSFPQESLPRHRQLCTPSHRSQADPPQLSGGLGFNPQGSGSSPSPCHYSQTCSNSSCHRGKESQAGETPLPFSCSLLPSPISIIPPPAPSPLPRNLKSLLRL